MTRNHTVLSVNIDLFTSSGTGIKDYKTNISIMKTTMATAKFFPEGRIERCNFVVPILVSIVLTLTGFFCHCSSRDANYDR